MKNRETFIKQHFICDLSYYLNTFLFSKRSYKGTSKNTVAQTLCKGKETCGVASLTGWIVTYFLWRVNRHTVKTKAGTVLFSLSGASE